MTQFEIPVLRDQSESTVTLRDYQTEAVDAVLGYLADHPKGRPAIQLPTGAGKTVVFAEIAKRIGYPVLVIAHRDELLDQAAEKFQMIDPGVTVGKVKAESNQWGTEVVVASIQTLFRTNRLEQIPKDRFKLVIVDECHHATADSYQTVMGYFDGTPMLGVSATLERGDGSGLGGVFDELVYQKDILWMIEQGYLTDITAKQIELKQLNVGRMTVNRGDFQNGASGRALSAAGAPEIALKAYVEHAPERKAIAFTPTVELAHEFAEVFNENGVTCEAIDGSTPRTERQQIYARLRSGETRVVASCAVLTEGFDEPSVDCIIMSRPTLSRVFFIQALGRGMRLFPGKTDCLVLDMVANTDRVRMVTVPNLFGFPTAWAQKGMGVVQAVAQVAQAAAAKVKRAAAGDIEAVLVDPFTQRKFRWVKTTAARGGEQRFALSAGDGLVVLKPTADGLYDVVHEPRRGEPKVLARALDLGYAQGAAEDYVKKLGNAILTKKDAAWRSRPVSDNQRNALRRWRVGDDVIDALENAGQASDLMTEVIARKKAKAA